MNQVSLPVVKVLSVVGQETTSCEISRAELKNMFSPQLWTEVTLHTHSHTHRGRVRTKVRQKKLNVFTSRLQLGDVKGGCHPGSHVDSSG